MYLNFIFETCISSMYRHIDNFIKKIIYKKKTELFEPGVSRCSSAILGNLANGQK